MKRFALAVAFVAAALLGCASGARACSVPYVFSNGTPADANQVNANFSALVSCINNPVLYASQMVPATVGQAVFGSALTYSFAHGLGVTGGLTADNAAVTGFLDVGGNVSIDGDLSLSGDPLAVNYGGTGTSSPSLVAGTNVTITGSWPDQTVAASASGAATFSLSATTSGSCAANTICTLTANVTVPNSPAHFHGSCTGSIPTNGYGPPPSVYFGYNNNTLVESDFPVIYNSTGSSISSGQSYTIDGACAT